jgi:hypothetical protein
MEIVFGALYSKINEYHYYINLDVNIFDYNNGLLLIFLIKIIDDSTTIKQKK